MDARGRTRAQAGASPSSIAGGAWRRGAILKPASYSGTSPKPTRGHEVRRLGLGELLSVLEWEDVDLVMIDVEGDEFALLADPFVGRAHTIVGELHLESARDFKCLADVMPTFDVSHEPVNGAGVVMFRTVRREEGSANR